MKLRAGAVLSRKQERLKAAPLSTDYLFYCSNTTRHYGRQQKALGAFQFWMALEPWSRKQTGTQEGNTASQS